jgi:hypothetical protein
MLYEAQKVVKVTAAGTQNVLASSGYMLALILSVAAPGTLTIVIQDKATPAVNKLMPTVDLTPPGSGAGVIVKNWTAPRPVRMDGGIDVVATGTGEVYLWVFYLFEPPSPT